MDTKQESVDLSRTAFARVLFCTDLSENADYAFRFAVDAVRRSTGSSLHILHVLPESEAQFWKTYVYEVEDVDNKAKRDLDDYMERSYLSTLPDGVAAKMEYRVGRDWQEILACAQDIHSDLIVMGRQGSGSLQKALFGNVTEKVVRKAKCAVLVVPDSYQRKHS